MNDEIHDDDDRDDRPRRRDHDDDYESRPPQSNPMALWAMICGIGSLICGLLLGIPALILGILGVSRAGKTGRGRGMSIAGIILGVISFPVSIALMIALLLPAVSKVREAAANAKNTNNAKQVGLAVLDYESTNTQFPKARHGATNAASGPSLSWRFTILPQLGENALYQSFKPNESWDSPANKTPSATVVSAYSDPADPPSSETRFQAFVGPGTVFYNSINPVRAATIPDGLANTLLFVETTKPAPWASAVDINYGGPRTTTFPVGKPNAKRFLACYADGSVRMLSTSISPATMNALIQIADGAVISPDGFGDPER